MKLHDEWIIGEGLESPGRWYVLHTIPPMFLAEICDEDEWEPGGLSWSLRDEQVACNVVFFDEPPVGKELDAMIFKLGEVMDDYDERVERRNARDKAAEDAMDED